jgi:hypothetical protein
MSRLIQLGRYAIKLSSIWAIAYNAKYTRSMMQEHAACILFRSFYLLFHDAPQQLHVALFVSWATSLPLHFLPHLLHYSPQTEPTILSDVLGMEGCLS